MLRSGVRKVSYGRNLRNTGDQSESKKLYCSFSIGSFFDRFITYFGPFYSFGPNLYRFLPFCFFVAISLCVEVCREEKEACVCFKSP